MSCVHAETTTLLWLYGELETHADAHAEHIASCEACSAAVELHSDLLHALSPALPAMSATPAAAAAARPANNLRWFALLALAAGLVVMVLTGTPSEAPSAPPAPALAAATGPVLGAHVSVDEFDPDFRDLDERLDALEADLDLL